MIKIRELRIQQNIQQKDMASILGIPANTYNQWENGKRQPDYQTLVKIAEYFNVSVDYLLGREETKTAPEPTDEEKLKVALFGGDDEVTDDMWDEVKNFVEFVKQKKKGGK